MGNTLYIKQNLKTKYTLQVEGSESEDANEAEDEDEDDDDDEDSEIMFSGQCRLFEKKDNQEKELGGVDLKIVYDDDVYGARIVANLNDDEDACNHLIAMQTNLEIVDDKKCAWSALDFSMNPPSYRNFVAQFDTAEVQQEFQDSFYEGKELAEQSEILEQGEHAEADEYYNNN